MLIALEELKKLGSWDVQRAEFGRYLGLNEPVSDTVLRRARDDDRYAGWLLMTRGNVKLLNLIINDSQNEAYKRTNSNAVEYGNSLPANLQLTTKVAKALIKWGVEGFKKVEPEEFERRLNICNSCPNLIDPPDRFVYKIKLSKKTNLRVCRACGCVASRKAALPTESCPEGYWESTGDRSTIL